MRKYLILTTILYIVIIPEIFGQISPCAPELSIEFNTQQEVDDFPSNYPNYAQISESIHIAEDYDGFDDNITNLDSLYQITSIEGSLNLIGGGTITDFSGLENLTSIGGCLSIDFAYDIVNFSGLENLNSIGGDFTIINSEDLTSLSGLENLNSIGGELHISSCFELTNITSLENLNSIGGNIDINGNDKLVSLSGLENITSIGGDLYIGNDLPTDFSGLENLTSIGRDLYIAGNGSLSNFSGLENLTSVGRNIYIGSNWVLTDLSGLENITSMGGSLEISGNNVLTDISGIGNINHTDILELSINYNNSLSLCGVESICKYLSNGGTANLEENAEGCNTIDEIIGSCEALLEYTVEGSVFSDNNADCVQDISESGLDNWLIKIEENGQLPRYTYTYNSGNYLIFANSGTQYTVTAIPPNMLWNNICPTSESVLISDDNPNGGVHFGATGNALCPLLEIDITAPFVRRCFDSNYYVRYCNSGTAVAENAYVEVQLDPFFTYQSSTIAGTDLGDNLYSFDLGNINIGDCGNFRIDVYVDCDSTELGQTHCVEAHIFPDSICSPALPLWDGSSIEVDAQCLGDSIEFIIENTGTGDMSDSLEYIIVEDNLIFMRAKFQLNSGDNQTFYEASTGAFYRLEAEQAPGHPGSSMPSVFVEGCGANDDGEISMGFVNYFLLDEGNAFVSIDCQENIGAYDPNDKQAFPVGYGDQHYITDSTDLEYMIRFQNTGTDTAFNIVIRDTISSHLNIETLRPGVASHPYRYDIEASNVAVFHFDNIMLPDSNVNEAASHGFIKFNIAQRENNAIGTHITNDAAIYFDFNEPIITNKVLHTVGQDFVGLVTSVTTSPEVEDAGISVHVFPNPFDEYTRFEVKGTISNELNLSLYDTMGREVLQQQSSNQSFIALYRNNLPPGIYIFKLMDDKQQLATGKLVVK